ncbi:hypothetical protein SAMD00019534_073550 [Acytostelium subglobosum LB1]|uniref:hypothetical protein n=1 Tax=Acytostelium subglobosum LB1 TaxID=1410327 RepID=UPI000644F6A2|nr:hypothetical protein SAMD00019534_073550 [Acytostelium subglobosum LB1]GAM24180.1 hypothetical protein SAMD00019534_073550 [Acytostelium subglobosum LB1]|eukprot:XP_012753216.1 hypothetical protein SAMD00019534_073550 [Acytostelium subglobosum LB1]
MIDSLFDITLHLDNKYSLYHSQHITTIILQGKDDPTGDPVPWSTIERSFPTQSLEHKKNDINALFQSLTARPNSTVTVAIRHVFAGQVAQLIENYSLDPQSIDSLVVNNLFPQTFQSMVDRLPINNQLKTLDLRVLTVLCCSKREDLIKIEYQLYCNELIERCTNMTSLSIYDECGSGHTGYSEYVVGKADQFFGMLDQLPHLVSLSFGFDTSCGHDHVDPLEDEDRQSFLAELISFMQRRPSFHTLSLRNYLEDTESYDNDDDNDDEPKSEHLPILDYLFTDVTCPVQHLTLELWGAKLPVLQRRINTLVLKEWSRPGYSQISWHQDMAMIAHLKTMVDDKLDLSGYSMRRPKECELDKEFRLESLYGPRQYIPPLLN